MNVRDGICYNLTHYLQIQITYTNFFLHIRTFVRQDTNSAYKNIIQTKHFLRIKYLGNKGKFPNKMSAQAQGWQRVSVNIFELHQI